MVNEVINFEGNIYALPTLYRGCANYDTIKKAMSKSGIFFHSQIPDFYSGIAIASVLKTYYYSFKPYFLSGSSQHSNGAAFLYSNQANKKKFVDEDNIPFHSKLAGADIMNSVPLLIAESLWQAQDHIPSAKRFEIDMKRLLQITVEKAICNPHRHYETVIDAVKKIAHLNNIEDCLPQIILKHKCEMPEIEPVLGVDIINGYLQVDCTDFGVHNVYEASLLCKHVMILNELGYYSKKGIFKTTLSLITKDFLVRGFFKRERVIGILKRNFLKWFSLKSLFK
jgi:hypothetical protein